METFREKKHYYSLDLLRILGAFGIVWFHAPGEVVGKNVGYSGLVIFIVISMALMIPRIPGPRFAVKRVNRLLVPWIFWYLIYGALNVASGNSFLPTEMNPLSAILSGPKWHLWYLPFLFVTSISIYYLVLLLKGLKGIGAISFYVFLSLLGLFTTGLWRAWSMNMGSPWAQCVHALPAVFIGAAMGYISMTHSETKRNVYIAACFLIIGGTSAWLVFSGYNGVGIPYLIGTGLTGAALIFNMRRSKIVTDISNLTFGIYLIHPLVYLLVIKFMKIEFPPSGYIIFMVFVISALLTLCIKMAVPRFSKWIV